MIEQSYQRERTRMVEKQIAVRGICDARVLEAMNSVPRHEFVTPKDRDIAYSDCPLPIGHGQTISQPYIVALMTELLRLNTSSVVLEVGTGSGYQAAVLGELAKEIHTVELVPELALKAGEILKHLGYTHVHVHQGDGSLGWKEAAPYDGILVAAAGPQVPAPLLDQLADGGYLVAPVGGLGTQILEMVHRRGKEYIRKQIIPVAFVPLRGEHGWKSN